MSAPASGPEPLRLCLTGSALPAQLSRVRARIAAWAGAAGLVEDTVDDLVLATHEALANVADHAYPDAERRGGEVVVVVSDRGQWRPPATDPGWRGRGLVIIRGLAEHVELHRGPTGTAVEMRWALPGQAPP
jgi:serine/threonine-protein kinase RsbW